METDLNKTLSSTSANDAAFNQKSVAGTGMDDEGRKELEAQWTRVCDRLRKEIGDKAFKTGLGEADRGEPTAGKVAAYAPPRSAWNWVSLHCGDRVLAYW